MRTSTRVLPQSTFELPVVEPSHREASLKPYLATHIEELLADKLDWAPPGWKSPEMCGSLSHAPVLRTMRTIPLHVSVFVRVRFYLVFDSVFPTNDPKLSRKLINPVWSIAPHHFLWKKLDRNDSINVQCIQWYSFLVRPPFGFLFHAFLVPHSLQYLTVPYLTITLFLVPAKQDAAVAPPKRRLWRLLIPCSVCSPLGVQRRAQSE